MQKHSSSFRDPSGFIFMHDGFVYRQINEMYRMNYDLLMSSGLFDELCSKKWIIPHQEVSMEPFQVQNYYKTIKPEQISFISYPYEWSFSQLKDAALLTLKIQQKSIEYGMSLKDASAYNIQFKEGKPVFIDTLSFEAYEDGKPWVAYRQFCQHFLAPLALMAKKDIRFGQLLKCHLDGFPLDFASNLLPFSSRFSFPYLMHIHLHAKSIKKHEDSRMEKKKVRISRFSLLALIDNLSGIIKDLEWKPSGTEWGDYYNDTNYSEKGLEYKKAVIEKYISEITPSVVWDFGGNTGFFTRLASDKGIESLCFDIDPAAVEKNYRKVKKQKEKNILPLLLDLTNPSPGLGWKNNERKKISERGHADMILALALIHHLCIGNNVPLENTAEFFALHGDYLIIEFVPKEDSQVQRLLSSREDVFSEYDVENFERQFLKFYEIKEKTPIEGTLRCLYLMKKIK